MKRKFFDIENKKEEKEIQAIRDYCATLSDKMNKLDDMTPIPSKSFSLFLNSDLNSTSQILSFLDKKNNWNDYQNNWDDYQQTCLRYRFLKFYLDEFDSKKLPEKINEHQLFVELMKLGKFSNCLSINLKF